MRSFTSQFVLVLAFVFAAQVSIASGDAKFLVPVAANEIKIMQYNVENLFDVQHDEGKNDWEFLPINYPGKTDFCNSLQDSFKRNCLSTDWTDQKLLVKLNQIKRSIMIQGSLPDVLTLNEIENENVIYKLARVLGYTGVLITHSPDERGVDVAILFNEDKISYMAHREVQLQGPSFVQKPTRNLLGAYFQVDMGSKNSKSKQLMLAVYANHWPSQAATSDKRVETGKQLANMIEQDIAKYGSDLSVVASGDFNTIDGESPHPFTSSILSPSWKNALLDVYTVYAKTGDPMLSQMPSGTYFFPKEKNWNMLDHFFISKNLLDGARLDMVPTSFRIMAADQISHDFGNVRVPWRYEHNSSDPNTAGFSDHYPVIMKLKVQ